MKVATSQEMAEIDRQTIEGIGIPGIVLMENAGLSVVECIGERCESLPELCVTILCGKGNNGGDGFVIARHLWNQGCEVQVLLLAEEEAITGDARSNLDILTAMGVPVEELPDGEAWDAYGYDLLSSDLVVDALLGTGIKGPVHGFYQDIIQDLNAVETPVVSVDIPSGLCGDTWEVEGKAVIADLTVTLALPKYAHLFPPAEQYVGELVVADIGIPESVVQASNLQLEVLDADLAPLFPPRPPDSHKGDYGRVLIIAGSRGMTGAATLAGLGALRIGAGLVTILTPSSCHEILEAKLTEVMTHPLPETEVSTLHMDGLDEALRWAEQSDVVVIGPGLGRHEKTDAFVRHLVGQIQQPIVIDADALNAFVSRANELKTNGPPLIATPHPGELARLMEKKTNEIQDDRLAAARAISKTNGIYTVLKGYRSLIVAPGGQAYLNLTGNPGMSSGGTGDVLTGMIGGLLPRLAPDDLHYGVAAAVHLHGLAGDIAAEVMGETSLNASDVIDFLPEAIQEATDSIEEEDE